jgi:hypothetical protein
VTTEEREIVTKRKDDLDNWEEVADDRIRQRRQRMKERLNPGKKIVILNQKPSYDFFYNHNASVVVDFFLSKRTRLLVAL